MIAHDELTEPILVVDFGTSTSSAALLADGRERLLKEPSTGSTSWPSAVYLENGRMMVGTPAERGKRRNPSGYRSEFKRDLGQSARISLDDHQYRPDELVTAVLRAFRDTAFAASGRQVDRLLVTVPASYSHSDPRRAAMVLAGRQAGFVDVELLAEPVAAAAAPIAGNPWQQGDLVLVYDFGGGTFDTALVRVGRQGGEVLGHAALDDCGGRDIDAAISARLQTDSQDWLPPLMERSETTALRLRLDLADLVRRLKHQLAETDRAEDYLHPDFLSSVLTIDDLRTMAAPLLDRTIVRCLTLLDDAGFVPSDLTGVLLVGGSTRMRVVGEALAERLQLPLRLAEDPELAVVYGAARWAEGTLRRRAAPRPPGRLVQAVRWVVPGDVATLTRWLVQPGQSYPVGAALARIRLTDGALFDLLADTAGTVIRQHVGPDQGLLSDDWAVTVRLPAEPQDLLDTPERVLRRTGVVAAVAVSQNGKRLALCGDGTLTVLSLPEGVEQHAQPYPGRINSLRWTTDGTRLGYGHNGDGHGVHLLDTTTWDDQVMVTYPAAVHDIAFNASARHMAVGCGDGVVRVHDLVRRLEVFAADLPNWVDTVDIHPRGRLVAAGSRQDDAGAIGVWDLLGGPERPPLSFGKPVRDIEYSPDGQFLAVAGGDVTSGGFAVVLDAGTMQPRHDLTAKWCSGASIRAVAFSPNGRIFAAAGEDGVIQLWDTDSGTDLRTVTAGSAVTSLAVSPDGDALVVGAENELTVWALTQHGLDRYQGKDSLE